MPIRINAGVSVGGLLTFGTITSLFSKIVYELQGEGLEGRHHFHKPLWMCTTMFIGMTACLPIAYYEAYMDRKAKRERRDSESPLLGGDQDDEVEEHSFRKEMVDVAYLLFPTVFDLIATVLMNVGLLWVTASVYQMMRGAEMIFAAGLGIIFLKRHLNKWHLGGMLCCLVGITLVGCASLLSGEGSASQKIEPFFILLGMALIVLSQCVQAAQLTFEDYFLSEMDMAPMKIVGYEGLLGFLLMVCVLLPAAQLMPGKDGSGLHENTLDTLHMIANSPTIAIVLAIDCFCLLSYNFCGMSVTGNLGAVFRTVLETMRTLFVWIVDLILFYGFPALKLGESWTPYSFIQAGGFVVLVAGTMIYGKGNETEIEKIVAEEIEHMSEPNVPTSALGVPAVTSAEPIAMASSRSSYKATMTMASGSYGGSYRAGHSFSRH